MNIQSKRVVPTVEGMWEKYTQLNIPLRINTANIDVY